MRLLTLLAGYAAGLAVAMKYRKDAGTSKLHAGKSGSKVDAFIDEVVDIHRSAYEDVKGFVITNFDDVKDIDSLKLKVTTILDSALTEAESYISKLQNDGITKKETLLEKLDVFFSEREKALTSAKQKGASFADTATENILVWIDQAKTKLHDIHTRVRAEIEEVPVTVKKSPKKVTSKK